MKAFFDRHEVDKKGATFGEQGKGWQAWNGWGGDAGYAWARKVVGQMESTDKKTEFVAGRDCGQDEGGTFGPDNKCAIGYGRPPLKGGYTPTRPGGKFPKNYKRPTEKEKPQQKPLPPKPSTPTGKPALPPPPPPPTGKPVKQTESQKKVSEINNRFIKDGIQASLPENSTRAEEIEKSYNNLKSKGYEMPPPDQIFTMDLQKAYGGDYEGTYAVATRSKAGAEQMIFNSTMYSRVDDKVIFDLETDVKNKWLVSTDVFAHEYAHNAHIKSIGKEQAGVYRVWKFGKISKATVSKVSKYAQKNALEFVAETFAGHANGKKYDKDVYKLYEYFKGPKLK